MQANAQTAVEFLTHWRRQPTRVNPQTALDLWAAKMRELGALWNEQVKKTKLRNPKALRLLERKNIAELNCAFYRRRLKEIIGD
jgi:hypothetical protein